MLVRLFHLIGMKTDIIYWFHHGDVGRMIQYALEEQFRLDKLDIAIWRENRAWEKSKEVLAKWPRSSNGGTTSGVESSDD
jgi:hypothetical protein